MALREVIVGSRVGLHARPAALFVKAGAEQPVKITIRKGDGAPVDARSILRVLALGARNGDTVDPRGRWRGRRRSAGDGRPTWSPRTTTIPPEPS